MNLLDTLVQNLTTSKRMMFGSIAYFANGYMFAGVFEDSIFLRLSEDDRKKLKSKDEDIVHFEPLEGRKMREYVVLSENFCKNIPLFENWLERSFDFVMSMPVKKK